MKTGGGSNFSPGDLSADPELWYACAGLVKTLPPVNSVVAYFPQGHIEQIAPFDNPDAELRVPDYNLPAVVRCTLEDIKLSADPSTDEVYATLTLNVDDASSCNEPYGPVKPTTCGFSKTLTASDASSHGGLAIPKRGAEECLPPLDMTQDPPSQLLLAKDVHGNKWTFKHILRGDPKRHLFTTGWGAFLAKKRPAVGDVVVFLRGEDGEFRVGVRRASKRQKVQSKVLTSPTMTIGVLAAAAHAVSGKSRFSLIYNPRSCPSDYVIPYSKYVKATKNDFGVGQRFQMNFESEDSPAGRYTGTVTGTTDHDPVRWPSSVWRSLQVVWDELPSGDRQERVSPWEIEPFSAGPAVPIQLKTRKRWRGPNNSSNIRRNVRIGFKPEILHLQASSLTRVPHAEHRQNYSRDAMTPFQTMGSTGPVVPSRMSWDVDCEDGFKNQGIVGKRTNNEYCLPLRRHGFIPANGSLCLVKLDGQRDMMKVGKKQEEQLNDCVKSQGLDLQLSLSSTAPGVCTAAKPCSPPPVIAPNVKFWEERVGSAYGTAAVENCKIFGVALVARETSSVSSQASGTKLLRNLDQGSSQTSGQFGEILEIPSNNSVTSAVRGGLRLEKPGVPSKWPKSVPQVPARSYIKVHKHGAIGRSIDLTKYDGYSPLVEEVENMFGFNGELFDKNSSWQLVYTDNEEDVLMVGDDPWEEFCNCVRSIRVVPKALLGKLTSTTHKKRKAK